MPDRTPQPPPGTMSFGEHLEELRRRIIIALVGVVPIFILSLLVGRTVLAHLMTPVQQALLDSNLPGKLQLTGVLEHFSAYVRICFVLTITIGAPWLIWQLWKFIAPGLYASEKRFAYLLAPMSVLLTLAGVTFMYRIMLPVVLAFFIGFSTSFSAPGLPERTEPLPQGVSLAQIPVLDADPVDPEPGAMWVNGPLKELRICLRQAEAGSGGAPLVLASPLAGAGPVMLQYRVSEYVGMILTFALTFAVAFQMPVVVLLLGWAGVVQPATLVKYRKQAVFTCAVLAALLTPTDPFSMLLLFAPLYGLYEFGQLLLRVLPAERVAAGFDFFSRRARTPVEDARPS